MENAWREVSTSWQGGTAFLGTNKDGAQIQIGKLEGQSGVGPMEAVLTALAACTGDDVLAILNKKRQHVTELKINVRGKRAENPPKVYTEIHVEYILRGNDLQEKDIEKAIRLSEEKYCSVGAMLGKTARICTSFKMLTLDETTN
ncbi:MAG: OsmC family protein [Chloroflexi bacterium]|nr:OsmC family protein [Chloroflexota bacterium]